MGFFDRFKKNKKDDEFAEETNYNPENSSSENGSSENENASYEGEPQNDIPHNEENLNNGDFESEDGSNATISRNKGISKNMVVMGALCVVGAVILFGARMLFNGGKLQKDPQTQTDNNKIDIADDQPIGIEDANGDTGDLLNEAEKQQQEQDATSTDTSGATEDGGISEEEFRKSLEQSDNAGSQWDNVGSSPESFGGSSGNSDLSEAGGKLSAEDIRAAEEAEKKKQRDDKLAQARAGGLSFMSNQQAGESNSSGGAGNNGGTITASNGRVDPNQVPAGTYSVAPDGTVTQVSGGGNGGGQQSSNPQHQNTDPFRQTNPAITGRGAAGYGSVNTNSGTLSAQNSRFVLSAGQIIPATLLSGIRTITADMAIAVVSSDVYDTRSGKHLLIPRGSKILGEYTPYIDGANFRVITIWNRIIFPNGDSLNLAQFKGVDLQGYGGMKAQVNTHFWKKLGNVVMSTLTAVAYNFADRLTIENGKVKLAKYQVKDNTGQNTTDNPTTLGQVIQQIQNEAQNKNSQIQTVLTIKSGARFNIRVNSDIILDSAYKPYYK